MHTSLEDQVTQSERSERRVQAVDEMRAPNILIAWDDMTYNIPLGAPLNVKGGGGFIHLPRSGFTGLKDYTYYQIIGKF